MRFTLQAMAAADVYSDKQIAVLKALETHWHGLTVFHEYPEVPMDNNPAERELRGLVVGRKNYYGSGAVWSGELAAKLYSIFRTLKIWGVNSQSWMNAYLDACAAERCAAPKNAARFLPWNMDPELRRELTIDSSVPPDAALATVSNLDAVERKFSRRRPPPRDLRTTRSRQGVRGNRMFTAPPSPLKIRGRLLQRGDVKRSRGRRCAARLWRRSLPYDRSARPHYGICLPQGPARP